MPGIDCEPLSSTPAERLCVRRGISGRMLLLAAGAAFGLACGQSSTSSEPADRGATAASAPAPPNAGTPGANPSAAGSDREESGTAPADDAAAKRLEQRPERVVKTVDWGAASTDRSREEAGLPAALVAEMKQVTIPVLLPTDDAILGSMTLVGSPLSYGASFRATTHGVAIDGTNVAMVAPSIEGASSAPGEQRIHRGEGSVTLTFQRYGVAYAVTVECDSPESDPHCLEDAYVRSIAQQLAPVNKPPVMTP